MVYNIIQSVYIIYWSIVWELDKKKKKVYKTKQKKKKIIWNLLDKDRWISAGSFLKLNGAKQNKKKPVRTKKKKNNGELVLFSKKMSINIFLIRFLYKSVRIIRDAKVTSQHRLLKL